MAEGFKIKMVKKLNSRIPVFVFTAANTIREDVRERERTGSELGPNWAGG